MSEVYLDSKEVYGQTIPRVVDPAQTVERMAEEASKVRFISDRQEIEFEEKLDIDNRGTRKVPTFRVSLVRDSSTGRIYMVFSLSEKRNVGVNIDYVA